MNSMTFKKGDIPHNKRLTSLEDFIVDNIIMTESCWIWTGLKHSAGYGCFGWNNKLLYSHRVSYEIYRGKIPKNTELDHLCRNRICCNPYHLELVTHKENVLRGESLSAKNKKKTHCKHGHKFTKENTYVRPDRKGRNCLICKKIVKNRFESKRKACRAV